MPKLIRQHDGADRAILVEDAVLDRVYFNCIRLSPGEIFELRLPRHECVIVLMSGTADILVHGERFAAVGGRADVWSGVADSVYAPLGATIKIEALAVPVEVAIAGGLTEERYSAFRIRPDEVETVEVGSPGTHSRRRILHILGQNGRGRTGHLLVSELYADDGCWSGYPPHKHDTDRGEGETDHQELYHYRFLPPSGFGVQVTYDGEKETCFMTRDRDTVLVDSGYHPTVTSPGHRSYIFTILVGKAHRGLVQYFDPAHLHLTETIPGIQAMRDKFK
ncbi:MULTISPECIES: 5-deoxy-glucuronate isomerase [unclassified Chelatococcus]|uniref:5-deoxy-glucuronate isomerase n=1 Tax=unclassified Chelatococcus TaxID=2638111 RepID=UPI001BCBB4D7|nr:MULTISPECIES: 5-deoxy-glucuronate isomerase [unclassified Chelatococcus]CAH1648430.1 5-deoxy-glucuronate isomerase [Hyphomicrobiales bacterium]MBS7741947.1 5-deoxy-glucuronate isomerase [Chelatococcus sp. HY11]MBX3541255.1 5-deoxy-glucuronate isomerase [Chelatococcus sp.]MCO5074852.1 5-deoxy-glucuronate isomerase [Chelatococcus sp.]CAH1690993.1 5-deoxy-glucuronate isomerase [Hyphomicrobiales bacterium]